MKTNFKLGTAIAISFGSLLCASAAYADGWPTSIQGTWSIIGNQSNGGIVSITQPSSTLDCQPISGSTSGNWGAATIKGFYCPKSGRINFIRVFNNNPIQSFQGNLSTNASTLYMGGTFAILDPIGGSLGEYNFSASK
jgi:hypothetical protein